MEIEGLVPDRQLAQMQKAVDSQLSAAWGRTDVFERRATTVLSVIGVVFTVLFSVLALVDLESMSGWSKASATLAVVFLIVSGGCCMDVLRPRDVEVVADSVLRDLWTQQLANPDYQIVQIQAQVLGEIITPAKGKKSVLESAKDEAQARGRSLLWGMWAFAVGVFLLACTIVLVLWAKM